MKPSRLFPTALLALGLAAGTPLALAEPDSSNPHAIVVENLSRASFADTVAALKSQLASDGWNLVAEIDLGARLAKKNVNLPGGLTILEFTSGGSTISLLKNEATRYVAGLMPCSVSVYGMDDGRIVVSRMNTTAMAGMMEPRVSEVLTQSAARLDASIAAALAKAGS